ncbi:MAG: hypothetical protein K8T89_20520 [Planctomycetes bacterium]|nr:hypothetical protein [Planctomycetota bacterium]
MPLLSPKDSRVCLPMHMAKGISLSGARLGGRPPLNVRPRVASRYFATIPLTDDDETELSVFVSFSSFSDLANDGAFRLVMNDHKVHVIIHGRSQRDLASTFSSDIKSEHSLAISPAISDANDDPAEPLAGHKIGGNPLIIVKRPILMTNLAAAISQGYRLYCQFDFAVSGDDTWQGTWPFGQGLFQVFIKEPVKQEEILWMWQM